MSDVPDRGSVRTIRPARRELDVTVRVPGSKSVTNRALLLAALASGSSTLHGALAAGLRSLGFAVDEDAAGGALHASAAGRIPAAEADVYCAEAGTAARFLLAACAAGEGRYRLDAAPQLRRRPLAQLLEALRAQGARTEPPDADRLPLTLKARGLTGGSLRLPDDTSSQFISALLMAAPLGHANLELAVDGLVSRPYVDMTLAMMARFGVAAERCGHERFRVAPGVYSGRDYAVEPDASTASYFFAAAAVTGGRVKVLGLRREGCLQGDIRFLDVLEAMGCSVSDEPDGVVVAGPGTPAGLTADMSDISDTFMTLAAMRSDSLRRTLAMPVIVTGELAKGATAARVMNVSEKSLMSAVRPAGVPEPATTTPSGSSLTEQPIASSTSRKRMSPWRQPSRRSPSTLTRPPVTAAAAKKYDAVEASGSTA